MSHATDHVMLSRLIQDPVAAHATDGGEVSSLLRDDYLNRGTTHVQRLVMQLVAGDRDRLSRFLSGLKAIWQPTWASAGTTLVAGFRTWIEVKYSTAAMVYHPSKVELDANLNPNLQPAFTITGGKIYGYAAGAALNAGSGDVHYLRDDQTTTSAGTTYMDNLFVQDVIMAAAGFHFFDKGDIDRGIILHKQVNQSVIGAVRTA